MMDSIDQSFLQSLARDGVIVRDPDMVELYRRAATLGATGANILIIGESGTGKDHFAKYLHQKSGRGSRSFIHLNCSAIPGELFESELFGYEHGAFSGTLSAGKPGLAELADGGTLYLDEIGELTPKNQVKLLHFLETKTLTRLGGGQPRKIDSHIIAATNQDLWSSIKSGLFRADLYYRIRTIEISIPPLRERPQDILALIEHFEQTHGSLHSFDQAATNFLLSRPWAGNVRELMNFLEKLNVLEEPGTITLDTLTGERYHFSSLKAAPPPPPSATKYKTLKQALADFERSYITAAIQQTSTLTEAAQILDIDLTTLNRKKRQLGIYKKDRPTQEA